MTNHTAWPDTHTYRFREAGVLLQELHDAVGQLGMVADQGLDLVQGDEHTQEELFMLLLQWESETVDDAAQDLQQFGRPVMFFSFVYKPGKSIGDMQG